MKRVSNLILAVEVRCHKVQGMTEAFHYSIILGKFICCLAQKSGNYVWLFGELNCSFLHVSVKASIMPCTL